MNVKEGHLPGYGRVVLMQAPENGIVELTDRHGVTTRYDLRRQPPLVLKDSHVADEYWAAMHQRWLQDKN